MRKSKIIITCDSCGKNKPVKIIEVGDHKIDICVDCLKAFAESSYVKKYILRFVNITQPPSFGIADPGFDD